MSDVIELLLIVMGCYTSKETIKCIGLSLLPIKITIL